MIQNKKEYQEALKRVREYKEVIKAQENKMSTDERNGYHGISIDRAQKIMNLFHVRFGFWNLFRRGSKVAPTSVRILFLGIPQLK